NGARIECPSFLERPPYPLKKIFLCYEPKPPSLGTADFLLTPGDIPESSTPFPPAANVLMIPSPRDTLVWYAFILVTSPEWYLPTATQGSWCFCRLYLRIMAPMKAHTRVSRRSSF